MDFHHIIAHLQGYGLRPGDIVAGQETRLYLQAVYRFTGFIHQSLQDIIAACDIVVGQAVGSQQVRGGPGAITILAAGRTLADKHAFRRSLLVTDSSSNSASLDSLFFAGGACSEGFRLPGNQQKLR